MDTGINYAAEVGLSLEEKKSLVANAALNYLVDDTIIGVGTGSTVNHFIAALAPLRYRIKGAVPSSLASAAALKKHGIPLASLNDAGELPMYFDGADAANRFGQLIKGGGGALTWEKIVAAASRRFICMIDDEKLRDYLGDSFSPLPVEVLPMARSYVARELVKLGGRPVYRIGFTTDNQNVILDVADLDISEPIALEEKLNHIAGIVSNGLFARRPADLLLVSGENGSIRKIER